MNPDQNTELEDAISFGQIAPQDQDDEIESPDTDTLGEGDRDPNAQGISNRPGDMDPDQGIDPEPRNNA